jgi:hypothetical protein
VASGSECDTTDEGNALHTIVGRLYSEWRGDIVF